MTNTGKIYWKIAGCINLFTAIVHTVGGQIDLVTPLLNSHLQTQTKAEWLGGWHLITVMLFLTSFWLLKMGFSTKKSPSEDVLKLIGYFYIMGSVSFIISSIYFNVLAPQWIILLPIGILTLLGINKS